MKNKSEISNTPEFYDIPDRREPNVAHELLSAIVFAVFVGCLLWWLV